MTEQVTNAESFARASFYAQGFGGHIPIADGNPGSAGSGSDDIDCEYYQKDVMQQ